VKLGVIARTEARGLGNQSYEVCRNLDPERVLLIDPGPDKRFTQHPERYKKWDTTTALWRGVRLDERVVRPWLRGLDVVYSAETPYDARLPQWAAEVGCGVVVHANPEFLAAHDAKVPVTWWAATPWRLEHLPARTRLVPMPCPEPGATHGPGNRVRFLHVAGWPTVADRNGSGIVAEAATLMTSDADVIIRGQHRDVVRYQRHTPRLRAEAGSVTNHWDLYQGVDVLVMPRRFGGLCLPVLEALAVGLPAVMSDCSPNNLWPGPRVETTSTGTVVTRGGVLPLHDTDPHALAATLDEIASTPDLLAKLRREATEWATANSWDALRPMWLAELQRACW
jgi:hypothetical protein